MMRSAGAVFAAACVLLASCDGRRAVGLVVGDPTGLSIKQELSGGEALVIGVGLDSFDRDVYYGNIDWIRYEGRPGSGEMVLYWGLGAAIVARTDAQTAGLRVPLGVDVFLQGASGDLFLELAPTVWPEAEDVNLGVAVGIRFFL